MNNGLQKLLDMARERWEYNEVTARAILRHCGFTSYQSEYHWEYVQRLKEYNEIHNPKYIVTKCPICGSETILDHNLDRKFGCYWGWDCTSNPNHFMAHQWEHLKGFFTRNIGNDNV